MVAVKIAQGKKAMDAACSERQSGYARAGSLLADSCDMVLLLPRLFSSNFCCTALQLMLVEAR